MKLRRIRNKLWADIRDLTMPIAIVGAMLQRVMEAIADIEPIIRRPSKLRSATTNGNRAAMAAALGFAAGRIWSSCTLATWAAPTRVLKRN